jgi:transcriptional regulator with XRE-family HTH domain
MENESRQLASYLRRRRKSLSLTQAKVAELSGRSQAHVARLESGTADPTLSTLSQVFRSLGVELVPVPIRMLSAVQFLIEEADGSFTPKRTRLVGNQPESALEGSDED